MHVRVRGKQLLLEESHAPEQSPRQYHCCPAVMPGWCAVAHICLLLLLSPVSLTAFSVAPASGQRMAAYYPEALSWVFGRGGAWHRLSADVPGVSTLVRVAV
ncbi:hypothetical protein M440DRAFT_158142 [Trichoderma longibrachiatum ATCC 18648]|uniref:Uncharacterized protein n=1 Tax=Trichoderma longibrachiatum ATCC 18648 TaxID=983965 RepID=A0A2T4BT44_TRILO|nr:hypothetical protein M440DRAFT_158142 [Trichoderma longibrachiatum ATCC 18648]